MASLNCSTPFSKEPGTSGLPPSFNAWRIREKCSNPTLRPDGNLLLLLQCIGTGRITPHPPAWTAGCPTESGSRKRPRVVGLFTGEEVLTLDVGLSAPLLNEDSYALCGSCKCCNRIKKGVPPPCKPDSVHPVLRRGWTVISLNPACAGRPACAGCD